MNYFRDWIFVFCFCFSLISLWIGGKYHKQDYGVLAVSAIFALLALAIKP